MHCFILFLHFDLPALHLMILSSIWTACKQEELLSNDSLYC